MRVWASPFCCSLPWSSCFEVPLTRHFIPWSAFPLRFRFQMKSSDVLKVFRVVMLVFGGKRGQLMWLVHLVKMHPGWLPRGISKRAETSGSPQPILGLYSPSVLCPLRVTDRASGGGGIMAFSTRMKMSKWRVHECLHVLMQPFTKPFKWIQARGTNFLSSLELWHLTKYFEVLVDCTNPEILRLSNSKTSNLMPFSPSFALLWCREPSRLYAVFAALRQSQTDSFETFRGMQRWKPRSPVSEEHCFTLTSLELLISYLQKTGSVYTTNHADF